jgi:hypothetical protein
MTTKTIPPGELEQQLLGRLNTINHRLAARSASRKRSQRGRARGWFATAGVGFALFALFASALVALAAPPKPAADLDQCRNGGVGEPVQKCIGGAWQNGNAGKENSHYREGESISYQARVTNLPAGASVSLIMAYDVIHSGKHAIDYLTGNDRWQPPETTVAANPDTPTATGSATLVGIPQPLTNVQVDPSQTLASGNCQKAGGGATQQPVTSFLAVPAAERNMEFYNVSGTPTLSYVGPAPSLLATNGDQQQQIQAVFIANSAGIVTLSWGGHIASRLDWGCADGPTSAGGISGSPYHMRLIDLVVNNNHINLGNTDRSLSAGAVVTPPNVSLSKTPSATNVCNGNTVDYQYVVSNTGIVAISGTVRDDNGTPGNTGDDFDVGTYTNLAGGANATFNRLGVTINGTVTNIARTTATSGDGLTATAQATATVTGHVCTITVTKSADADSVCSGHSTTYDFSITNNSSFNWSGSLIDDVVGTIADPLSLTPGETKSFLNVAGPNLTQNTTNTVTAAGAFDDPDATATNDTASDTVNVSDCTITVTKSADADQVCSGDSTTYDFSITNNSGFNWTGSLIDDVVGTIADPLSLTPGETKSFLNVAGPALTQDTTNTVTAAGAFDDPDATATNDTASDTVDVVNCNTSQLAPTQTTCQQFRDGTAGVEDTISYGVKSGKINNVSPGVLFYYTQVTVGAGGAFDIVQTNTQVNYTLFGVQSVQVFNPVTCTLRSATFTVTTGLETQTIHVVVSGASAGDTFIANVKIDPSTVKGKTPPSPATMDFTYATVVGAVTQTSATGHLAPKQP